MSRPQVLTESQWRELNGTFGICTLDRAARKAVTILRNQAPLIPGHNTRVESSSPITIGDCVIPPWASWDIDWGIGVNLSIKIDKGRYIYGDNPPIKAARIRCEVSSGSSTLSPQKMLVQADLHQKVAMLAAVIESSLPDLYRIESNSH